MENGIKVGPDGQFTIIQTHLPNMYQRGLKPASQDCDTRILTTMLLSYTKGTYLEGEYI